MQHRLKQLGGCLGVLSLVGCASLDPPDNIEEIDAGNGYQAQYRSPDVARRDADFLRSEALNQQDCRPPLGGTGGKGGGAVNAALSGQRLSRNDLLDIRVGDDEVFNGAYVVSRDGTIRLPFLDPIRGQGRSTDEIEDEIATQLIAEEFYVDRPRISVRVKDLDAVSVAVSGAVFEPHAMTIGGAPGDQIDTDRQRALGASTEGRNLSAALRSAGGVRPDADLSAVELHRGGRVYRLDLRGVFEGRNAVDVMLLTGDEIVVPSRFCFQDDLMRPSPISPPGVTLFLSNLTQPASSNATSAIGREAREVPYGTRYLQAVVDTNCVGGARATNANRSAVLMSRNPETEDSVVIERNIEDLLRRKDRDDFDPYLLPGDAIACYDSSVTNLAEVARILGLIAVGAALASQ